MAAKGTGTACKGVLGAVPRILVMGTLGKCSRNSGRFPFLPQEHRRTGSGMDTKPVAVTVKQLKRSPESSTRIEELCLAQPP